MRAEISKKIVGDIDHVETDEQYSPIAEYNKSVILRNVDAYREMKMLALVPSSPYPPQHAVLSMKEIIKELMCYPKGIFLFDDEPRAVGVKLAAIDVMNTLKNRKKMYGAFLAAIEPDHISGVVLSEEILEYCLDPTVLLIEGLKEKGILFGPRVDKGVGPLSGKFRDECRTDGIDQLYPRLSNLKKVGCKFAKWRSVFRISDTTPSHLGLSVNCSAIGRFAAITQSLDLISIIELELISSKTFFTLEHSAKVLEKVLVAVIKTLSDFNVSIETVIIQTSMPQCNIGCRTGKITSKVLAQTMLMCLKRSIPTATGAVTILSGGMSEDLASVTFSKLMCIKDEFSPWPITFAFGKAMTHSAIRVWDPEACEEAQEQLRRRLAANALARTGCFKSGAMVTVAMNEDLMQELIQ